MESFLRRGFIPIELDILHVDWIEPEQAQL
jgi:hypothetical protein